LRCRRNDQAKRHGGGNSGNRRSSSHHQSCPGESARTRYQSRTLIALLTRGIRRGKGDGPVRWTPHSAEGLHMKGISAFQRSV
jgi:hypothetical protein